jgi:hypothetical protein
MDQAFSFLKGTEYDRPQRPSSPHPTPWRIPGFEVLSDGEIVHDGTAVFCDRFVDRRSPTHDQMVQAARNRKP